MFIAQYSDLRCVRGEWLGTRWPRRVSCHEFDFWFFASLMIKKVQVAAAVMTRPDGRFLLGQRAPDTFYAGYWEFPGGKLEAGESARDALVRELEEELGIVVDEAWPWLVREHHYEHAHVTLHFFEVPAWRGEMKPHVHSAMVWQQADALSVEPMLPANGPILKSLRLPRQMGVTHAHEIGVAAQLLALDAALARGLRCVQIREPGLSELERAEFVRAVQTRCRAHGALCLLNASPAEALAAGVEGVHLSSAQLAALEVRPDLEWVGASCHTRAELERVAALGLDYAVLGSVLSTPSHPHGPTLGWEGFYALTRDLPMPVLAIGGLATGDTAQARAAGAHGMASIRAAWAAE